MKLVDHKNRKLKIGQKVCVQVDIPSPDGMLYKDTIVKLDEFNKETKKLRVTDSTGKVWWVEPSQVSSSFLQKDEVKMRDYDVFKKWLGGVLDLMQGAPSMAQKALEKEMSMMYTDKKPKRARTKGRYKADDKSTKDVNEAWVDGKSPKKRKK